MKARRGQFTICACRFSLMYFQEIHQKEVLLGALTCEDIFSQGKNKLGKSKDGCLVGSIGQKQNFVLNMNSRIRHKTGKKRGALITGKPCFIVLCFIMLQREGIIYTLNIRGKPARSKSVSTIFVNVLSLRILVILTIFQAFSP